MNIRSASSLFSAWAAMFMLLIEALPVYGFSDEGGAAAEARVTWEDVVKLVDRHPLFASSRQKVASAEAEVEAAGAVPNPGMEATTAYGQARDTSASRVEWGLELSIPLGWMARRGAAIEKADAEAGVANAESSFLRRDLLLQLRILFLNLAYEQERVEALADLSEQTEALVRTVERRVENGESRPVEATRVEIEAEKIAGALEAARFALEMRRQQLGLWLGADREKMLTAVADLADIPRHRPASNSTEPRLDEHPNIVAARMRIHALEAGVSVERRARVPEASVKAFVDQELDRSAYGVGLAVDLPLWNWNTGGIRRAEAELAAGRERLDAEKMEMESALMEIGSSCQASAAFAERYRDRIHPRSVSAAKTVERAYELGEATLLEVIDARRTVLETRTDLLASYVKAHTDCSRLAVISGEELP